MNRIVQLLRCLVGKHERNKRRAYLDKSGTPRSRCRGCGRKMVKLDERWQLD